MRKPLADATAVPSLTLTHRLGQLDRADRADSPELAVAALTA